MTVLADFLRTTTGAALSAAVGLAALSSAPAQAEDLIAMERDTALCVERLGVLYEHYLGLGNVVATPDMTEVKRFEILRETVTAALNDERLTNEGPASELVDPGTIVPETAGKMHDVFERLNDDLSAECASNSEIIFKEFSDMSVAVAQGDHTAKAIADGFMMVVTDVFIKQNVAVSGYEFRLESLAESAGMNGG